MPGQPVSRMRLSTLRRCFRIASAAAAGSRSAMAWDDAGMFGKAVMISGRAQGGVAQPPPCDGPANGVQRIEKAKQQRVLRCLADGAVQFVVPLFVKAPGRRLLRLLHTAAHLGDLCRGCIQRSAPRHFWFKSDACAHHFKRVRSLNHGVDIGDRVDRAIAGECAFAHMPPDHALGLQGCQGLAQDRAAYIQGFRQFALGRQSAVIGQDGGGQKSLKFCEG